MSKNGTVFTHPMDLSEKDLLSGLDRRASNRATLCVWIGNSLIEGTDYAARRGNKKNLEKPGAEKIVSATGLTPTFPSLHKYEEAAYSGVDIKEIVIRCELEQNGRIIGTGIGGRSVKEHHGNINAALKMAKKSALIDAVLTTFGLSQMFQQDWNEKDQEEDRIRKVKANMKKKEYTEKAKIKTLDDMKEKEQKKDAKDQTKEELGNNIFAVIDKIDDDKIEKIEIIEFVKNKCGNRANFDNKTFAPSLTKDQLCNLAEGIKAILKGNKPI
tara:strand:+ start:5623 stop:6435 length:813 start_codon:yes stop_codon:yes gene_type:complete